MVPRQRELGKRGAVMNGRDIGTVVFLMRMSVFSNGCAGRKSRATFQGRSNN